MKIHYANDTRPACGNRHAKLTTADAGAVTCGSCFRTKRHRAVSNQHARACRLEHATTTARIIRGHRARVVLAIAVQHARGRVRKLAPGTGFTKRLATMGAEARTLGHRVPSILYGA